MATALCMAGVLSACSVGDAYQRPETDILARWRTSLNGRHAWPTPDWWRRFHSRRLNELMRQAMTDNFDIRAAMARIRQADAQVTIAAAPLLPLITGDGSVKRMQTPLLSSGGGASGGTSGPRRSGVLVRNDVLLQFNASYEIDFWGKNQAALETAEAEAAASRFDERTVQLTTQASVATTWFAILGGLERIKVAKNNVKDASGVLKAVNDQFTAGLASRLDVAQQENIVYAQQATIPPLERELQQNFNALSILIGAPPGQSSTGGEDLSSLRLPLIQPGLPSQLLNRRPDVQMAEAQLVAANGDITAARAALFPSIQLTAAFGWESTALGLLLRNRNLLWNVASSVTQTIFDAGRLRAGVEQNEARYAELAQTYRKTVIQAFADVENALIAVKKTAEEEKALEKAENSAREAFDIILQQKEGGVKDITTVLNTERSLFSAQDAHVAARLSHAQAVVSLYKALGGGWSPGAQGDDVERNWTASAIRR